MNDDVLVELKKMNRLLSALLTITVDRHLRDTEIAKPRPRSIDRMLADIGLQGTEIAKLLGKTPAAVSMALAKEKPTNKKNNSSADDGTEIAEKK